MRPKLTLIPQGEMVPVSRSEIDLRLLSTRSLWPRRCRRVTASEAPTKDDSATNPLEVATALTAASDLTQKDLNERMLQLVSEDRLRA